MKANGEFLLDIEKNRVFAIGVWAYPQNIIENKNVGYYTDTCKRCLGIKGYPTDYPIFDNSFENIKKEKNSYKRNGDIFWSRSEVTSSRRLYEGE